MIKFIATDLDGTLLPPKTGLPNEVFSLVDKLYERGIIFAPASGRQLENLKVMFAPVLDKIAIIAENGGLAYYKGEIIYSNPTPKKSVIYALNIIRGVSGLYPLLSGANCAYYESDNEDFVATVKASYTNTQRVDDLEEVADNDILKISVWDEVPPCANHGGKILPDKIKGLRVMVSGYDWLDVSVLNANKGLALKAVLDRFKISPADCVAFGDHMNDLEMLQLAGTAFVTANAFAGLKEHIKNEVPSNADYGVINKIKEYLK